jgi:hypothetical protein
MSDYVSERSNEVVHIPGYMDLFISILRGYEKRIIHTLRQQVSCSLETRPNESSRRPVQFEHISSGSLFQNGNRDRRGERSNEVVHIPGYMDLFISILRGYG